jgi:hypothetical protein
MTLRRLQIASIACIVVNYNYPSVSSSSELLLYSLHCKATSVHYRIYNRIALNTFIILSINHSSCLSTDHSHRLQHYTPIASLTKSALSESAHNMYSYQMPFLISSCAAPGASMGSFPSIISLLYLATHVQTSPHFCLFLFILLNTSLARDSDAASSVTLHLLQKFELLSR